MLIIPTKFYDNNEYLGEYFDTEDGLVLNVKGKDKSIEEIKAITHLMIEEYIELKRANMM